jgi:hypothetical protein
MQREPPKKDVTQKELKEWIDKASGEYPRSYSKRAFLREVSAAAKKNFN